ncbi:unnamed protein product [Symbiodinium sp. KB8]|nr:unnamed protein product [Symbiodinium sp. KB8]
MPWPYVMDMDKEPVQASGYEKYSSFAHSKTWLPTADNKSSVMDHLPKLAECCTQLAVDVKAKAFRQDAAGVLKGKPDALKSAPKAAVSEDVPVISALPTIKDVLQDQYDALKGKYDVLKGKYEALKDGHQAPTASASRESRKEHQHGDRAEVTCASRMPDYNLDRVTRPPQQGKHFKYNPSNRGEAATVFVIDSGINEGHEEFRRNDKGIVKVGLSPIVCLSPACYRMG